VFVKTHVPFSRVTLTQAQFFYIAELFYILAITLTKLSLLLFFRRIFPNKIIRTATVVLSIFIILSNFSILMALCLQCVSIIHTKSLALILILLTASVLRKLDELDVQDAACEVYRLILSNLRRSRIVHLPRPQHPHPADPNPLEPQAFLAEEGQPTCHVLSRILRHRMLASPTTIPPEDDRHQ
jgi:hypothetical protein